MNNCNLNHIPVYLHWGNKPIIPNFFHNEKLFRRVVKNTPEKSAFTTITLSDISVNRSGNDSSILSYEVDVLWNTMNTNPEKHLDCDVEVLEVVIGNFNTNTEKKIFDDYDKNEFIIIALLHDPLPCNYSHSIFRFIYKNQTIKYENYQNTFGNKKDKVAKRLRQAARDELRKMIISRKVIFD